MLILARTLIAEMFKFVQIVHQTDAPKIQLAHILSMICKQHTSPPPPPPPTHTPTHIHPHTPTPTHIHPPPPTPTHSHPLPPTPTHSHPHPHPPTPTHVHPHLLLVGPHHCQHVRHFAFQGCIILGQLRIALSHSVRGDSLLRMQMRETSEYAHRLLQPQALAVC